VGVLLALVCCRFLHHGPSYTDCYRALTFASDGFLVISAVSKAHVVILQEQLNQILVRLSSARSLRK